MGDRARKVRRIVAIASAVVVSFVVGLVIAFWLSRLDRDRLGIRESWITVRNIAGRESLVIDMPEQSPAGIPYSCDFIDVAIDDQSRCVDISHVVMLLNPFSRSCESNQPIVVRNDLSPGAYTVRYWDGNRFVILGRLSVEQARMGNSLKWRAAGRAGTEGISP